MRVYVLLGVGLVQLGACGPGLTSQNRAPALPLEPPVRAGHPPPSDEAGFRTLLAGDVANGGLWFADSECQARFGPSGTIAAPALDSFAHCVAGLHLHPTGREDTLDDTSVLTDDAGFEIEAHVASGRLDFIGFSARTPSTPNLPTITPAALEKIRAGGDPNATVTADAAAAIALPGSRNPTLAEHLRLCVGQNGQLTSVEPATTTTPESAAAFAAVARTWTFRPFVSGSVPIAVCAVVAFHYPASPGSGDRDRLPQPPQVSKAGRVVYNVSPVKLEQLRVAGSKLLVPDDEDKIHLNGKRLIGTFKLCLDETGHYERGVLLRSTGAPRYDAKIARAMMAEWTYRPYLVEGVATPVCTVITFIYSQH